VRGVQLPQTDKMRTNYSPKHLSRKSRRKAGCHRYRALGPWPAETWRHGDPLSWKRALKATLQRLRAPYKTVATDPSITRQATQHDGGRCGAALLTAHTFRTAHKRPIQGSTVLLCGQRESCRRPEPKKVSQHRGRGEGSSRQQRVRASQGFGI